MSLGTQRVPQPSAGARRRGTEHPKLLVEYNLLTYFKTYVICLTYCFFLFHFIGLPQEAYWEVGEGAKGPLSWVHTSLGTQRVPQLSAGVRRRVAVGHPNLLVLENCRMMR